MTPAFLPLDWYDLPLLYDMIFDQDTDRESDFLEIMHRRYGNGRTRWVLEPACGSGRLIEAMLRRGYRVAGFDANDKMLEYARARVRAFGRRVGLSRQRLERFQFGRRFGLAHCLVSTFKYLPTEATARSHLHCVANALAPHGIYVLGFHLSEYDNPSRTRERWTARRGGIGVTCNIQMWPADRRRRVERVRARLVAQRGRKVHRYQTEWWFRTYDVPQVRRLLRSVPDLEHVGTYDFDCDSGIERHLDGGRLDVVLILRKRR